MRWGINKFISLGTTRIREGFLWFPKKPSGSDEFRWLEYCIWEEQYLEYRNYKKTRYDLELAKVKMGWVATQWLTPEQKKRNKYKY